MYLVPLCLYCCPGKRVSHYLGDLHGSGLIVGLNCRFPDKKTSGQNKHSSSSSSLCGGDLCTYKGEYVQAITLSVPLTILRTLTIIVKQNSLVDEFVNLTE